jgi:hypothetical protein
MLSILHYIEAKARLQESIKTIEMMGGEDECQPMLLGQRDMLELEVEYHKDQSKKFIAFSLTFLAICVTLGYLNFHF